MKVKNFALIAAFFLATISACTQDISAGLECWYKFDYKAGDAYIKDYSGNERHIIPMKWGEAQDWSAMEFESVELAGEQQPFVYFPDTRDDAVVLSNNSSLWKGLEGNTPRTLCVWFRIDVGAEENAGQYLYFYGTENDAGGSYKAVLKGKCIEFEDAINTQANGWCNRNVAWINAMPQGTWHHLALVYNGQGGRRDGLSLYLNGNKVDFNPVSATSPQYAINTILQDAPEIGRYMKKMALADLRLYSRALSEAEIKKMVRGNFSDYTMEELRTLIQTAVYNKNARLVIPPGVYRGPSPFVGISNVSDMEIIADGVTMLCETRVRALNISNCKNLKIKGLTIDYEPLTFTQGDITAVGSNYVDVKIHEGYPRVANSRIDIIDPNTRFRKRGSVFVWESTAELIAEDVVRVYQSDLKVAARVGDMVTLSGGAEGMYGSPHTLAIEKCRGGIVLEDVTIHCGPGFGIFESEGEGSTVLRNCKVTPGPKPKGATQERLLSVSWDAIQHKLTKKGPLVEGCEVRDAGDDSWSVTWDGSYVISGVYAEGMRITLADGKVAPLQAGDTLRTSLNSEYVTIAQKSGDLLILNRVCPWPVGTHLYSPDRRCENFIVRNSRFRSSGRILIKAGHGLIENNIIEDGHSGVTVNSETNVTAISHLTIRNNTISGTGHFMPGSWSNQAGSISLVDGSNNTIAQAGAFEHITIENNNLSDISGVNMVLTSARDLKVKGNVFRKTGLTTPNNTGSAYGIDQNTVVYIKNCQTVLLDSNAVVNRQLSRLLVQSGVTGLTTLNGGVFDTTESAIETPDASKEANIFYKDNAITIRFPDEISEKILVRIYNSLGQLEERFLSSREGKEVRIPYYATSFGTKIVWVQRENVFAGASKIIIR